MTGYLFRPRRRVSYGARVLALLSCVGGATPAAADVSAANCSITTSTACDTERAVIDGWAAFSPAAAIVANSNVMAPTTVFYQAGADKQTWAGYLRARPALDQNEYTDGYWDAAQQLDELSAIDQRKIFTVRPAQLFAVSGEAVARQGIAFTWNALATTQQAALRHRSEADFSVAQQRLAYLRGDRNAEQPAGPFRQRASRMGDVLHSSPQFVYRSDFGYAALRWNAGTVAAAYTEFRQSPAYRTRPPLVIVGANDGMLHGFDASVGSTGSGQELFAYVPNGVFAHLQELSDPAYSHRYYVDATVRVADAWLDGRWKTLAVGTPGAGGKSVFALDITDPVHMTPDHVLWEFSHRHLGYHLAQPAVVALPNEQFAVVVSSGYQFPTVEQGYLWLLDAADGSVLREIAIPTTGNLGAPLAVDTDRDQVADRIYVADTEGNVWRIDMLGSNPAVWGVALGLRGRPLFVARDATGQRQTITAALASAVSNRGEPMLFFGTSGVGSSVVNSMYGLIDRSISIDGQDTLVEQAIIAQPGGENGQRTRVVSNHGIGAQDGWYLDLATPDPAEGIIGKALLRSNRVMFTTVELPTDRYSSPRAAFAMVIDLDSGARLDHGYFTRHRQRELTLENDGQQQASVNANILFDDTAADDQPLPTSGFSFLDNGVVTTPTPFYKWLCFASATASAPQCVHISGSQRLGRRSWREVD